MSYWYKQVGPRYDWTREGPGPAMPSVEEELADQAHTPIWGRIKIRFTSSASVVAIGDGSVLMRRRKHMVIPAIIGLVASYAVWDRVGKMGS